MPILTPLLSLTIAALLTTPAPAQPNPCADPSPHKQLFVEVTDGVRLEVLDWGGSGRAAQVASPCPKPVIPTEASRSFCIAFASARTRRPA